MAESSASSKLLNEKLLEATLEDHDGSSTQPSAEGKVSVNTISAVSGLVGVDLAKNVFSICEVDGRGRVLGRLVLRGEAFALWLH